ncbi:flavin reductase family protein [Xanthocytophaga agilis]|uniref:Flavin reductase n=1 Tax=Xanthocytophaga agilis TaxID=3048010 RepID=A0AAE3R8Z0_9BACT|nr:flavin reductase [Xanthocytophaga agilis]MDJ1502957.1 flavin reductase [Xanthocytophaga agilis]
MQRINEDAILNFETRYRAQFINSITGFKSLGLVGSRSHEGNTNLAIFSSFTHLGSNPALLACIFRPDSVERHTLSNILQTGFYTFNHIHENIYQQAHQTSARYAREISEFDAVGLTPEYKNGFWAPFCQESFLQVGLELKEKIDITINGTIMVIGQVKEVYIPDNTLHPDGYVDVEKAQTLCCSGLDSYHKTKRLHRLSYAKTDKEVTFLT